MNATHNFYTVQPKGAPEDIRKLPAAGDFSGIKEMVPTTTLQFLETKFPLGMSATR